MEGFLTKYGHESTVIFREMTFFTKYGHESRVCFLENGRFFKQIWAWEQLFLVKIGKNWYLIDFLAHFRETGSFFDKIWVWEYCVFIENRHFLTTYRKKNSYFSVQRSEKKCLLLTYRTQNILQFWQNLRFFTK